MSIGGRSAVGTPAKRPRPAAAGAAGDTATVSLTVGWLDAASVPVDSGVNYADYTYTPPDSLTQVTGYMANYAQRSGVDPVGLTVLTAGAATGAAPYTTDPVTLTGDFIVGFCVWSVTEGGIIGAGSTPSNLIHPDLTMGRDSEILTGFADPYGQMADYGDSWSGTSSTAPFTIPEMIGNTATGAAWVIVALDSCSATTNDNTNAEEDVDERRVRWSTTYTTELLLGAVGRVPGRPVAFLSPWSANTISASA